MTNPAPSFISAFSAAAALAAVATGLFLVDRVAGGMMRYAYDRSTWSPEELIRRAAPDTVVIGASGAKYAFDPAAWNGRLVNLAQDGETVVFTLALSAALPKAEGLRRVVLMIDPEDLSLGLGNPKTSRVWRIAPLIAEHPEVEAALPRPNSPWAPSSWSHLFRYRGAVGEIAKRIVQPEAAAYHPLPPGSITERPILPDKTTGTATIHSSLDALIALQAPASRKLDVDLILVPPPRYKRPWTNDDRALFTQVTQRFTAAGARVCDMFNLDTPELRDLRTTVGYFYDPEHLAGAAAIAYTRLMDREIENRCGRR